MTFQQSNRKDEHVAQALAQHSELSVSDFSQTRFVHHSFPELDVCDVQLQTTLNTLTLDTPFFINAMTGGSTKTYQLNHDLAVVARETQLAMATGSLSVALKDPDVLDSFSVARQVNPNGLLWANLGAHHSVDNAKRAVASIEANALQIHVNTPQELAMREGDRHFTGWLANIEHIVKTLDVPVIVKEVGFGMSRETVKTLYDLGVTIVDVAGQGGTNFVTIETARYQPEGATSLLASWGQSTLISLLEAMSLPQRPTIIASGGVKNALDIAKCLCVGANAVGLSGQILFQLHHHGIEQTITYINQLKDDLRTIMTLLGAENITALQRKQLIVAPSVQNWCDARGIDWKNLANR